MTNLPVLIQEEESYFFGILYSYLEDKYDIRLEKLRSWQPDIGTNLIVYNMELGEEFDMTARFTRCADIVKHIISSHLETEETYLDRSELKSDIISLETFGRIKNEMPNLLDNLQLTIEGLRGSFILSDIQGDLDWVFETSIIFSTILGITNLDELKNPAMVNTYVREFLIFLLLCSPRDQASIVRTETGPRLEDRFVSIGIEVRDELYEMITDIDVVKGSEILELLLEARELMLGDNNKCCFVRKLDTNMEIVICSYLDAS